MTSVSSGSCTFVSISWRVVVEVAVGCVEVMDIQLRLSWPSAPQVPQCLILR